MTARLARPDDADTIAEVHVRAWQAGYRGQLPDEFLDGLSVQARAQYWREALARTPPLEATFVLEYGGRVIGFAHAMPSRDLDAGETTGELAALNIVAEHWRRGGGRLLEARVREHLRAGGFREATLWVLATNARARRFYEALGWAPDGAGKQDRRDGLTLDELRYRLTI